VLGRFHRVLALVAAVVCSAQQAATLVLPAVQVELVNVKDVM
jgi:hypothetical protein